MMAVGKDVFSDGWSDSQRRKHELDAGLAKRAEVDAQKGSSRWDVT